MDEASVSACRDMVRQSYSSEREVAKYRERASSGLLNWEAALVRRYFPDQPGPLLDVGCGAGREAFALQELGYDVTAVDISEELVSAAISRAAELNRPIAFSCCDGQHLEFEDASFAYVIIPSQVLGNIPGATSRLAFLSEVRRVLRTNGVVIFCGHNRSVCERQAHREGVCTVFRRNGKRRSDLDRDGNRYAVLLALFRCRGNVCAL